MKPGLKDLLRFLCPFTNEELNAINQLFRPRTVYRNELLLSNGAVCREFYYVETGCLRTFFIDNKGNDKTRLILHDCTIGTALTSFINQSPSFELVEVLEDTHLCAISHTDFYALVGNMATWRQCYTRMLEMAYTYQNRRIESLMTLSARERYDEVMQQRPDLILRLSNKVLASYLDMSQETLSRLKSA